MGSGMYEYNADSEAKNKANLAACDMIDQLRCSVMSVLADVAQLQVDAFKIKHSCSDIGYGYSPEKCASAVGELVDLETQLHDLIVKLRGMVRDRQEGVEA